MCVRVHVSVCVCGCVRAGECNERRYKRAYYSPKLDALIKVNSLTIFAVKKFHVNRNVLPTSLTELASSFCTKYSSKSKRFMLTRSLSKNSVDRT